MSFKNAQRRIFFEHAAVVLLRKVLPAMVMMVIFDVTIKLNSDIV